MSRLGPSDPNQLLFQNMKERVVVMGELNDGPGRDYFEELYLTHNVTDIVLGSAFEPEFVFFHAQHDVSAVDRYIAVFDDFVTGEQGKQLLLDHIVHLPGAVWQDRAPEGSEIRQGSARRVEGRGGERRGTPGGPAE